MSRFSDKLKSGKRAPETAADLLRARRQKTARDPNEAKVPPNSPEAERGVLGCIMIDPNQSMGDCINRIKSPEAFYDLKHRAIWDFMVEMYDKREAIDAITLPQKLKDKQIIDQVGGYGYIAALSGEVPSATNLSYYIDILLEKHLLRRLQSACVDIGARIYEHDGEIQDLLDSAERDFLSIRQVSESSEVRDAKDLVRKAIDRIETTHNRQGALGGLSTGFTDWDKMTDGMHAGEMIVIAARPSIGKTSLAMNVAEHVAVNLKLPVGVFSLEMTAEELMVRMICSRSRVSSRNIRDGYMVERDFPKLTGSAGKLSSSPLYVDDTSGLSIMQLRARARRMWQQFGIKLFVIDYLQLLHSTTPRAKDSRVNEVTDISNGIKGLCKELGVPIIAISQLNRDLEREKGRRPRLADLRESGAIEQDADVVGLLYHEKSDDDEELSDCIEVNLMIAKQRNGPTGDVNLTFFKTYTRFESSAKVGYEDRPDYQPPPKEETQTSMPYADQ